VEGADGSAPAPRVRDGESAENDAYETLYGLAFADDGPEAWQLGQRVIAGGISRRVRLVRGRDYKARLAEQGRSEDSVRELRLARMSHWVAVRIPG
jgi:hypothetical protein